MFTVEKNPSSPKALISPVISLHKMQEIVAGTNSIFVCIYIQSYTLLHARDHFQLAFNSFAPSIYTPLQSASKWK